MPLPFGMTGWSGSPPLIFRILRLLLIAGLFVGLPSSASLSQELKTTYLPADEGFVPVLLHPENWRLDPNLPGLSTKDGGRITVNLYRWRKKRTWEEALKLHYDYGRRWTQENDKNRKQCGVFAYNEDSFLDNPAFFLERGVCVYRPEKKPAHFEWVALLNPNLQLRIYFNVGDKKAEIYAKYKDEAMSIASSVKLVPVAEISPDEPLLVLYDQRKDRRGIVASRRGGYHVNAFFRFYHWKTWSVRVLEAKHAGPDSEKGRMTLGVFEKRSEGQRGAILFMAIEGLKPGALTAEDFLATGPNLMKRLGVKTYEEIARRKEKYRPFWCVAHWAHRHSESTKQTIIRDYNAVSGNQVPWKMRVYTAGGLTVASNLIVAAPPDRFKAVLTQIQHSLDSLKLYLESPALKPWGKCGGG